MRVWIGVLSVVIAQVKKRHILFLLFLALAAVFLFLRFWQARDVFDLSLAPLCSLGQRMAVQYDLSYEDRLVLMDVDSTHAILKSIDPDIFPAAPSFYDAARDNEFVSVSGFLYVYPGTTLGRCSGKISSQLSDGLNKAVGGLLSSTTTRTGSFSVTLSVVGPDIDRRINGGELGGEGPNGGAEIS